jgi:hypothetical protein
MKTRRLRRKTRKTRRLIRAKRGGGESCYGNGKTWSCSAACGENGACQKLD